MDEPRAAATLKTVHEGDSTLILFMHGLCGDAEGTFTARNGKFWPTLLADDPVDYGGGKFGSHTIALLGYEPPNFNLTLPAITDHLRALLEQKKIGERYDRIIIIAHSLGGVAMMDLMPTLQAQHKVIHSKLRGVFLLGTPGQGAPWANWLGSVSQLLMMNVRCMAGTLPLATVGLNNYLDSMNRRWNEYLAARGAKKIPGVLCGYEGRYTGNFVAVVPKENTPGECDEGSMGFDADHIGIVKPESRDDAIYSWVRLKLGSELGLPPFDREQALADIFSLKDGSTNPQLNNLIANAEFIAAQRLSCPEAARLSETGRANLRNQWTTILQDLTAPWAARYRREFSDSELKEILTSVRSEYAKSEQIQTKAQVMFAHTRIEDLADESENARKRMANANLSKRYKYALAQRLWALVNMPQMLGALSRSLEMSEEQWAAAKVNMEKLEPLIVELLVSEYPIAEMRMRLSYLQSEVGRKVQRVQMDELAAMDMRSFAQRTKLLAEQVELSDVSCIAWAQ